MPVRARRGARTEPALALLAGLLSLAVLGWIVFAVTTSGDYGTHADPSGDNAAPGIEALLHGSLGGYLASQPIIGLTSILLRLPFAALAPAFGGGELTAYKLGALACMLPLALGAGCLIGERGLPAKHRLFRLLAALIVIQSPILRYAVQMGHPEDLVAAVLASASVVLASRGQARWAAILLGLAIGAKEWAVIATVPVMLALPGRRREVGAIAAGLALLLTCIAWLGNPAAFERALHVERTSPYLSPLSPLWPVGGRLRMFGGGYVKAARELPWGLSRSSASGLLTAITAVLGGVWYVRLRRRGGTCKPLCLLAILGALVCICDTNNEPYYWLALLIPVATWESTENRIPIATFAVSLLVWMLSNALGQASSTLIFLTALTAEAVLIAYLARQPDVAIRADSLFGAPAATGRPHVAGRI